MILERGDMWSVFEDDENGPDVFMITTNPIRRKDGAVVMGRGIAKEAKNRFPELPYHFGQVLENPSTMYARSLGYIGHYNHVPIWYFMVKNHWRNPASLSIITQSVDDFLTVGFTGRVDLNFPGIGNGHLDRETVLPIISRLPNNVHIWERE